MLRTGLSNIARRSVLRSSSSSKNIQPFSALQTLHYHSTRQNDEAVAAPAEKVPEVVKESGFLGTGISNWFALPAAMVLAVPAIKFEWLLINEEFQLAAVFVAFCVTFYTQAGDLVHKSLEEKGDAILKEQNEVEDKVIEALDKQLTLLRGNANIVQDFEAINAVRADTYAKLNEAGKIKPLHDFKGQMEKMLSMIAQEEASVSEKLKVELLKNATLDVHEQFASNKQLKKSALDSAIAAIKGEETSDPVKDAFAAYFQKKAKEITAEDAKKEEEAQRSALVAKMNSIAKNEGFMFELDAQGNPKMVA